MAAALSETSRAQWTIFFQTAVKIGTIGGSVTSVAYLILGHDSTYPCTVTALSACAWFSTWITESNSSRQAADNRPLNERIHQSISEAIDVLSEKVKNTINEKKDTFIDNAIKGAVIASLPPVIGSSVANSTAGSLKVVGTALVNGSVNSTGTLTKKSTGSLINKLL